VIAGGVEREAKMAAEPRHFHRGNRTSNSRSFSSYIASHIIDSYYIVCNVMVSSLTVNGCLGRRDLPPPLGRALVITGKQRERNHHV
jgi:hypothetical protein